MQRLIAPYIIGLLLLVCLPLANIASGDAPPSLKTVPVPEPDNLFDFIKDKAAAIRLGKALFWDQQVGGDGVMSCAGCHFHAGADSRTKNQLNPGANGIFDVASLDSTLSPVDFPFTSDEDDIAGSQGVESRQFDGIVVGSAVDDNTPTPHPIFVTKRQVTGRNAPNVINAIFNEDNFWDGRAKNTFNGVNGAGDEDQNARVLEVQPNGSVVQVQISIEDASLASQAVGPPNNAVEMSWDGRTFPELGRKLINNGLTPLAQQFVALGDSVLGGLLSNFPAQGLDTSYNQMIEDAFLEKWWDSSAIVNGFTVKENNFSLFWGLAVQLYVATLVSDETPFDQFAEGDDSALTQQQQDGLDVFLNEGRCIACHNGAEFTAASSQNGNNGKAFTNTGVRPVSEDPGREDGEFKTPGLRNVELTGPYFHTGNKSTLRQVIDFYDQGGDFPNEETNSQIRPLELTEAEKVALVDFLLALSDERVRFERAPFDHPSLDVPNGPSLSAVGASGSLVALGTFLGLDPFDAAAPPAPAPAIVRDPRSAPDGSSLEQNYPNPPNPETWIPYKLANDANVEITIYTADGQHVRTLKLGFQPAGSYLTRNKAAYWDGHNDAGERVSSGVYFYHLKGGDYHATRKLIVLK